MTKSTLFCKKKGPPLEKWRAYIFSLPNLPDQHYHSGPRVVNLNKKKDQPYGESWPEFVIISSTLPYYHA